MLLQSVFADVQGFCDFCIVLIRIDACKNLLLPVGELIFPAQSGDNCIGAAAPDGGGAQPVSTALRWSPRERIKNISSSVKLPSALVRNRVSTPSIFC